MTIPSRENKQPTSPYKTVGAIFFVVSAVVCTLVYFQFQGDFKSKMPLTMLAARSGLVLEPGSKVTYNGVAIGRVSSISEVEHDGKPAAKLMLGVDPKYVQFIPANVDASIVATTVFGNKYVSFTSPKDPAPQSITADAVIDATSVTTEFNTLFETITSIAEKVDPVKLNATLSGVADAVSGLGTKFGDSIMNANAVLDDLNPRMDQFRYDIRRLGDLADVYTDASPDLWKFVDNAVKTSHTLNRQQSNLDQALMASVGFGNTGADIFERGGPYLVRGVHDLLPTSQLLDEYSPELLCVIRNYAEATPIVTDVEAGNGYAAKVNAQILGVENPYVYPDNLPRTNARGGPGGRPGCWAPITRDLWPTPYLVMDSGVSIAPYNHFDLGQPLMTEYVWGRQVGENTINP
ncbi:MAG: phospholipid/cholesterol/gamma-HCH transport system substrate-binding protein [Mycobacterium sp.]|nr:phospholipid/cholesterol/gamma-HCH transport system substrate-binding protein [Mycobacterium sp.]